MTRWEYQFIEIQRNKYDDLMRVLADIRQAGADGWEAVGQVSFACPGVPMPVLMLKRPLR